MILQAVIWLLSDLRTYLFTIYLRKYSSCPCNPIQVYVCIYFRDIHRTCVRTFHLLYLGKSPDITDIFHSCVYLTIFWFHFWNAFIILRYPIPKTENSMVLSTSISLENRFQLPILNELVLFISFWNVLILSLSHTPEINYSKQSRWFLGSSFSTTTSTETFG